MPLGLWWLCGWFMNKVQYCKKQLLPSGCCFMEELAFVRGSGSGGEEWSRPWGKTSLPSRRPGKPGRGPDCLGASPEACARQHALFSGPSPLSTSTLPLECSGDGGQGQADPTFARHLSSPSPTNSSTPTHSAWDEGVKLREMGRWKELRQNRREQEKEPPAPAAPIHSHW